MLLLHNAKIYTMSARKAEADAILIGTHQKECGRILGVGNRNDLSRTSNGNIEEIDLDGRILLPGLCDAHIHFKRYAQNLALLDVDTKSKAECLEKVRHKAIESRKGAWILGHGWRQNDWPEGFGLAEELDRVAPENPVYLTAASLHAAWINSEAMKLAGIQEQSPDPPKGEYQRDKDGKLTGILLEKAMDVVSSIVPKPDEHEMAKMMERAQGKLWRYGLTAIHDFDRVGSFRALQKNAPRGKT